MPDNPLLLLVQVSCAPEHQGPFNTWYNSHLPNLLRIPAYLWAQRYICIEDNNRFSALYGVRSVDDLPTILQREGPHMHPIAAKEFAAWVNLMGISDRLTNVYEQIYGDPLRDPLLLSDRPLSLVTVDVDPAHEEEFNRWYNESHVPNLLKVPGYVLAGRFRALDHPAVKNFNTGHRYLAIYEHESEEIIPSLRDREKMSPEARAEFGMWESVGKPHTTGFGWGFYRLISKHFKWPNPE